MHLIQGECRVSDDPRVVLTTLLGSCVAVCLHDPKAGLGGMNHFLLPSGGNARAGGERYGVNAMEILINDLLKMGARRSRLVAKLFGGAQLGDGMAHIGAENARFAERFLHVEGIPCVASSLGGALPRRVRFVPSNGRASQAFVHDSPPAKATISTAPPAGDVDLFDGGPV